MLDFFKRNSYLFGGNAPFVEDLYESYLKDPNSVPEQWRNYFDGLSNVPASDGSNAPDRAHQPVINSFVERAKQGPIRTILASANSEMARKRTNVQRLIAAYRNFGSRWANLDPLKMLERAQIRDLEPDFYGFTDADMDIQFNVSNTYFGKETMSLRELLDALKDTYCNTIGAEFMYITDPEQKRWWQEKLESSRARPKYGPTKKIDILRKLTAAEGLERYLHSRYVGQKRFSLEGSESFLVALEEVIELAGGAGVQEIVIGMAHRGRLNVLVNTLGKAPRDLFDEFEGKHGDDLPAGDVKYHQGFSSDVPTAGGPVHLSLAFNPSHLEIVNPVVEGSTRCRQDIRGDHDGSQVMSVLVHGDAAFSGQGVVMETLNLALTRYYGTGGTVHLVINNQIGFTTSDPRDTRSTIYCTDVVKMIEAPVLHVNGDDPEAVAFAAQLALEYRMKFRRNVVVDIVSYRKLGHNEQDTPSVTQPIMYRHIGQHPGTRQVYADRLQGQGVLAAGQAEQMINDYRQQLEIGDTVDPVITDYKSKYAVDWTPFLGKKWTDDADTSVPLSELKRLAKLITTIPSDFKLHPLVEKVIADRKAMGNDEIPLDWGMGEHLAFATLLSNGYGVRLSGQDSARGTFSHRHAMLVNQNSAHRYDPDYIPLQNIKPNQPPFVVINSVLSEEAVLGFEYGYATSAPNTMVIWEAQFGDFANGAQVVIDQFIASGEVKWGRANGLVLMLPHGYEGQGPEHSSARLERFLQLCAEQNMQVVQPTNPAQIFHVLRRQMIRQFRKPLVIMTPKSLLRHKQAVSPLQDLAKGRFKTVIGEEAAVVNAQEVKRAIVCSGRLYYDLLAKREENKANIPILRIEQLYPFPHKALESELKLYPNLKEIIWAQDEPQNQGAWFYIEHHLEEAAGSKVTVKYAGRPASASPAVGYYAKHLEQLRKLIDDAFTK